MPQKTITAVHTVIDGIKNYVSEISPAAAPGMYLVTYTTDVNNAIDFFNIPNAEKNISRFVNHYNRYFLIQQATIVVDQLAYEGDLK